MAGSGAYAPWSTAGKKKPIFVRPCPQARFLICQMSDCIEMRHRPLISPGKRELADHVQRHISVDCRLTLRYRNFPCPEPPLDLHNHLCSRTTVLLLLCPLFGNESGRTCVGLGVYGPVLPLVLPGDATFFASSWAAMEERSPRLPARWRQPPEQ